MKESIELQIADALSDIAMWLKYLGTGNSGTEVGAIEYLAGEIHEGLTDVSNAIYELARAMENK